MHTSTSIVMRAPRGRIFELTTDLARWPELLPHYRSIDFLERHSDHDIVRMACVRDGIPLAWVSRLEIDRPRMEMRFTHLRAWTKGMVVIWTYIETPDGVLVEIAHDLKFRVRLLAPLAERIIGGFFIDNVATKTLRAFKTHLEAEVAR